MSERVLYRDGVEPGTTRELDGVRVRFVTASEYYRLLVGNTLNVEAIFMDMADRLGPDELGDVDAAVADEYWNHYEGCTIPPLLLDLIAKHSTGDDALSSILEQSRRKIVTPDIELDEAITQRTRIRVTLLKYALDGVIDYHQTAIGEFMADVFLLQRAIMEDVLKAEEIKGPDGTRAEAFQEMDADGSLAHDVILPMIVRPEIIRKAIPQKLALALDELGEKRPPYFMMGLLPQSEEG